MAEVKTCRIHNAVVRLEASFERSRASIQELKELLTDMEEKEKQRDKEMCVSAVRFLVMLDTLEEMTTPPGPSDELSKKVREFAQEAFQRCSQHESG